eukprot:3341029-Lingulodinium_polyedra.AAC.1
MTTRGCDASPVVQHWQLEWSQFGLEKSIVGGWRFEVAVFSEEGDIDSVLSGVCGFKYEGDAFVQNVLVCKPQWRRGHLWTPQIGVLFVDA